MKTQGAHQYALFESVETLPIESTELLKLNVRRFSEYVVFADKKTNLPGLQLADLIARPVGINYLRPTQGNQAFECLKEKFFCDGGRAGVGKGYQNVGLQVYPPQKAKSPDVPTEAIAPTGNPQST